MPDPSTSAPFVDADDMEDLLTEIARRKVLEMIEEVQERTPRDDRLRAVTLTAALFYLADISAQGIGAAAVSSAPGALPLYRAHLAQAVQIGFDRGVEITAKDATDA